MREVVIITEARPEDAAALARIELVSPESGRIRLRVSPVQDYFAVDRATPGMRALVARTADGCAVGTVSYRVSESRLATGSAPVAYHSRLRVAPEYRRLGVATRLLREACARAMHDGAVLSWGAIMGGNERALAACRAADYEVIGGLEARIFPVQWLAKLPSARRYSAWLERGVERPATARGQLAELGAAPPDLERWSTRAPNDTIAPTGLTTRDLSPYWRLGVIGGPSLFLSGARVLSRLGWLPEVSSGLRLTVGGGGWITEQRTHDGRAMLLALCAALRETCDVLVTVADSRSAYAAATRGVPSLRSTLWLVAQPSSLLDPNQLFEAFAF